MTPSNAEEKARAHGFFEITTIFEKPALPKRGEHRCRFKVEVSAADIAETPAGKGKTPAEAEAERHPPLSHICLILDLSGSMSNDGKYELLLEALRRFLERVTENIFVSAVAFSEGAEQIVFAERGDRMRARTFLKQLDRSRVKFGGRTEMAAGMRMGERLCRLFSSEYPGAITRIYMMTDGMVHDHYECLDCAERFITLDAEVHTFGIGRGDYDLTVLRDITNRCIGGSVKLIKNVDRIGLAFDRIGKTTARIFATGVRVAFHAAPGVLCNQVFLFRPREADVSNSISPDSTKWEFGGWPNFESKRTYQILFETLLPVEKGGNSAVGTFAVEGRVGDIHTEERAQLTVLRKAWPRGEPNQQVQKAFTSCAVLSSKDPDIILEALEAKRDLYILEGRHEDDIREIEDRISEVKAIGESMFDLGEDALEDMYDAGDAISIESLETGYGAGNGNFGEDNGVSNGSLEDDEPDISGDPDEEDNDDPFST